MHIQCQICGDFSASNGKCAQCSFEGNDVLFLNQEQARYWMGHHVAKFRKELFEKQREEIAERERQLQTSTAKISELETLVKSRDVEISKSRGEIDELKGQARDELQELREQNPKLKTLVKSQENEIQKLQSDNKQLENKLQELAKKQSAAQPLSAPKSAVFDWRLESLLENKSQELAKKQSTAQPLSAPKSAGLQLLDSLMEQPQEMQTAKGKYFNRQIPTDTKAAFHTHRDYKNLLARIEEELEKLKYDDVVFYDEIKFGRYSWRILTTDRQNGKALLLSEKIIEQRKYENCLENTTWATCTLRHYLNGAFYDRFSKEEKLQIVETMIPNNNNPWYGTSGGNATNDKVFLLSIEEVVEYFGDSGQLRNIPSLKTLGISDRYNSVRQAKDYSGSGSWWWLRSPGGEDTSYAAFVYEDGRVSIKGASVLEDFGGVRPALWLNLLKSSVEIC